MNIVLKHTWIYLHQHAFGISATWREQHNYNIIGDGKKTRRDEEEGKTEDILDRRGARKKR